MFVSIRRCGSFAFINAHDFLCKSKKPKASGVHMMAGFTAATCTFQNESSARNTLAYASTLISPDTSQFAWDQPINITSLPIRFENRHPLKTDFESCIKVDVDELQKIIRLSKTVQ
jgi:hypothetical protein